MRSREKKEYNDLLEAFSFREQGIEKIFRNRFTRVCHLYV